MHHNYTSGLDDFSTSEQYRREVNIRAIPLVKNNLPVILSLNHLAVLSNSSFVELQSHVFSNHKSSGYQVFPIKKRSGGKRWICVPEPFLKSSQHFINQEILYSPFALKKLSEACTAYVPHKGQIANARLHHSSRDILKIDLSNFFESISERQVFQVFKRLGYHPYVAFILARVCTRTIDIGKDNRFRKKGRWSTKKQYKLNLPNLGSEPKLQVGHLPQGAPSSPMLANLVCIDLDSKIDAIATEYELMYSRYADDIVLSGNISDPRPLISKIYRILANNGFSPNKNKTKFLRQGQRKIVTGLSIEDSACLRVPRAYKQKIRQELYYIEKHGLQAHCQHLDYKNPLSYALRLDGKINYVRKIEPELGQKFHEQLNQAVPELQLYKSL